MDNFSLLGKGGEKNDCIFPLPERAIGIGTDPNKCSIIYVQAKNGISEFHCQLVPKQGKWTLTDYSAKGTWLNGQKMTPYQAYPLKSGDVFYLAVLENSFYFSADNALNLNQGQPPTPVNHGQFPPSNNVGKTQPVNNFGQTQPPNNFGQPPLPNNFGQNQNQNQATPLQSKWLEIKQKFFSWEGRLNRKVYIQRWLFIMVLQLIISGIQSHFVDPMYVTESLRESDMNKPIFVADYLDVFWKYTFIFILISLPVTISGYMLAIRRLHDFNKSGWWTGIFAFFTAVMYYVLYEAIQMTTSALGRDVISFSKDEESTVMLCVILVSIASIACLVFVLFLFFKKGTNGPNRYGPDPLV